jgi:hypothetical protein
MQLAHGLAPRPEKPKDTPTQAPEGSASFLCPPRPAPEGSASSLCPPLLPQNKKSAEPEKVEKARSTSLGAQAATTTAVATNADAKPISVSAPPTPEIDHNLNPDYDHSDHANLERTLFDRLSSTHKTQDTRRIYILLSRSRSRSLAIATGHQRQATVGARG